MIKENINKEIENIIQSGVPEMKVKASPFFTTRVMGKVEQLEEESAFFPLLDYILKPVFVLLILVNVFNFYFSEKISNNSGGADNTIELVSADYTSFSNDFIYSDDLLLSNN